MSLLFGHTRRFLLGACIAMALAAPAIPQNKTEINGVIEGRVTRPGGAEGIPEVQVTLQLAQEGDNGVLQSLYTDSDGRFSFKKAPEGRYTVTVSRDGYFALPPAGSMNLGAPLQASASATIIAGYSPPTLAFTLVRGGVISGHLRDPNGRLMPNIPIAAYQLVYRDGHAALATVKASQTDDRGEYRMFWMAPGNYIIAANPRRPSGVPAPQDVYARTFYPGLIDARIVPPVVVTDGADIPSVDILIRPDAIAKISGRVVSPFVGENDQPTPPASAMYLIPRDTNALAESSPPIVQNVASNRANGRFEIRNVMPGSYDLLASAPDASGRAAWGRTRVDVGTIDLEDVIIDIRPGFEVKVRISIDGDDGLSSRPAPAAPNTEGRSSPIVEVAPRGGEGRGASTAQAAPERPLLQLSLLSSDPYAILQPAANANTGFDPSTGLFTFPSVPEGRYRLQVGALPSNAYVEDLREGSVSMFDEGITVAGLAAGEITLLVNTKGATVKGLVNAADQNPFDGALVALVPVLARRSNITLYKTARSDEKGQFEINGVAPGEYRLFAWESVPANAWLNADFLALQESRGKSVTVTAAGSTSVDLKVIPREIR